MQNNGRSLTKSMLIYPLFVSDDPDAEQVIETLPGQKRWGINKLEAFVGPLVKKGLKGVIIFGVPERMNKVDLLDITYTELYRILEGAQLTTQIHLPFWLSTSCPWLSLSCFSARMFVFASTLRMVTAAYCRRFRAQIIPTPQPLTPRLLLNELPRSPLHMPKQALTA